MTALHSIKPSMFKNYRPLTALIKVKGCGEIESNYALVLLQKKWFIMLFGDSKTRVKLESMMNYFPCNVVFLFSFLA